MRLFPDTTLPLIFFISWVELLDFSDARTPSSPQGREGLQKLSQDVRHLLKMLTHGVNMSEMMEDFEHDLTSLPTLKFGAKDLKSIEMSSALAELYSGLKSFLFHLDWLQRKQKQTETDFSKTQKIAHQMKIISLRVRALMETAPSEPIFPTLPPLNTYWDMYQATMEIYKKLFLFCDWNTRALRVLLHRR